MVGFFDDPMMSMYGSAQQPGFMSNPGLGPFATNLGMALIAAGSGGGAPRSRFADAAPFMQQAVQAPMQLRQQQVMQKLYGAQIGKLEADAARQKQMDEARAGLSNQLRAPSMMPMSEMEGNSAGLFADVPQANRQMAVSLLDAGVEPEKVLPSLMPKPMDPKDRYMNVPDVGLVDISGEAPRTAMAAPPKAATPPAGYMFGEGGKLTFVPGGPADPAQIGAEANARTPFYFQEVRAEDGSVSTVAIPRSALNAPTAAPQAPDAAPSPAPGPQLPPGAQVISTKPATMTEAQANAATYADRMVAAHALLNDFETEGTSLFGRTMEDTPGGNYLQTPEYQQFEQARRDFINATLRKESGAVISPEEFKNAEKQYFPKPGDSAEVIKQKRDNREAAIKGISRAAGPSYKPNVDAKKAPSGAPLVGTVEGGYRYKGGDPGNPKSWEKVS